MAEPMSDERRLPFGEVEIMREPLTANQIAELAATYADAYHELRWPLRRPLRWIGWHWLLILGAWQFWACFCVNPLLKYLHYSHAITEHAEGMVRTGRTFR